MSAKCRKGIFQPDEYAGRDKGFNSAPQYLAG
jgi:hypothetical protein